MGHLAGIQTVPLPSYSRGQNSMKFTFKLVIFATAVIIQYSGTPIDLQNWESEKLIVKNVMFDII